MTNVAFKELAKLYATQMQRVALIKFVQTESAILAAEVIQCAIKVKPALTINAKVRYSQNLTLFL